jgi:HlyD family secretion protein
MLKPESKSDSRQAVRLPITGEAGDSAPEIDTPVSPPVFKVEPLKPASRPKPDPNSSAADRWGGANIRTKTVILVSTLVLLSVAAVATVHYVTEPKPSDAANSNVAQTVTVATAKRQDVEDLLTVTGSVSAWDPLNVGAEVGGLRITQVNVEEGDRVIKGQPLLYLNSALLQAQLDESRAKLASSEAALKKAIQPNRSEDILALKATLAQAEADIVQEESLRQEAFFRLKDAELNAKRSEYLEREGAVSSLEKEAKDLAANTARDEVASAEAKINALKATADQNKQKLLEAQRGGRQEDIDISKATIAQTKAEIQHLTEQINQTVVRAPDDGVISQRMAHLGETTTVGLPLFSIIRMNRLEMRAQVPDIDLHKFHPAQSVTVTSSDEDGRTAVGTVRLVSPQVDDASRIGIVRIDVPSDAGLKPGMFARAQVKLGHHNAVVVPPQAIVHRNGESFVFLLNGDRAESCTVKAGLETDKFVEVKEGLKDGQVVVSQGARFLTDHDIIRVSR